jgi:hypothetical protein
VIVPDVHDYALGFDRMLLTALENALHREGIDFRPKHHFLEAVNVIRNWKENGGTNAGDNPYQKLSNVLAAEYSTDPEILMGKLQKFSDEAYQVFENAHRRVAYGASFQPDATADPKKIYDQTIRYLQKEEGWQGIWLVCDEFGRHLTRLAKDPNSEESENIQLFAEYCKRSAEYQCHFTVIAHQSIADYAAGFKSEKDWEKIAGRFYPEHTLENIGSVHEDVEMIETIVLRKVESDQAVQEWKAINQNPSIPLVCDEVEDTGLFEVTDQEWLINHLIIGCFPLHPFTTFCLPWLARNLGQRERTLFTFFNDASKHGLRHFVDSESLYAGGGRLNLYTADRLIGYFEPTASTKTRDPRYKRIISARHEALNQVTDSPLSQRIVNILAVFELVGAQYIQATKDGVLNALYLDHRGRDSAQDLLTELVESRVIRRRLNGQYELRSRSEFDLQDAIRKDKRRLRDGFDRIDALKKLSGYEDATDAIIADGYRKGHFVRREAIRKAVSPASLANLQQYRERICGWYEPGVHKYEGDVLALYVLAEDSDEIRTANKQASLKESRHPQLVWAVPKTPWNVSEKLLQLLAMKELRSDSGSYASMTDADAEELSQDISDLEEELNIELTEFLRADNFTWH